VPAATRRPGYHPATLLKIYVCGYLNRIASSRRLEREAGRNLELIWLTGRLAPDFKTIADFRKDNGPAIRAACRQFVLLCRKLDLFSEALVAVDGSKFKAVNNRDKNFTPHKLQKRIEQIEESIARYLSAMEAADRHEDEVLKAKSARLKEKIAALREQVQRFRDLEPAVRAAPDQQISLTDPDARSMATSGRGTGIVGYNGQAAVDARHHLIVAHEVTNIGNDRAQPGFPVWPAFCWREAAKLCDFQQLAASSGNRGKTYGGQAGWQRSRTRSGRYGMAAWPMMPSRAPR
jgi:transposase